MTLPSATTHRRRLDLDRIAQAATEIDPVFLGSPQRRAVGLERSSGVQVIIKDETQNPIRSFKGRGADYYVRSLVDPPEPLVCASAGNFGQGLAWAARTRGVRCDVFAATTANPLKIDRMRALGATVHIAGDDFDAAKDAGREYAASHGVPFVEDGREPEISEGAGSIAVELCQAQSFDAVIIPLGNGALLGGIATWVKYRSPATRVIGVCAAGAPSMERSWRERRVVTTERADTVADGIAVRVPIPEALEDLASVVDDIWLVTDAEILAAMRLVHASENLMLEPAGAVGVAGIVSNRAALAGQVVATVLCGANVTDEQRSRWFG